MHGHPVGQNYNAQISVVHFGDSWPSPNPAVRLHRLVLRMFDRALNLLETNRSAIRPLAHRQKVLREFHSGASRAFRWRS
jgi:hypothetical protein